MVPHYNVVICTPGDMLYRTYVACLLNTIKHMEEAGITWTCVLGSSPHIPKTRALILNNGYESNGGFEEFMTNEKLSKWETFGGKFTYDQILWIDNDIIWSIDDFKKILGHQEEVVSGVYMFDNNKSVVASMEPGSILSVEELLEMNQTKLYEVHTCGMGFLKVRYGVTEKLQHPMFLLHQYDYYVEKHDKTYTFFTTDEDTSFCARVRESGRKVYLDPSIRVGHFKRVTLSAPQIENQ
jgi:hypothetical protein